MSVSKSKAAPWWQSKVTLYILSALLAIVSTLGGMMFNKVKTLETAKASVTKERDKALEAVKTAESKRTEAEQQARTNASRYRKLALATNPLTGAAIFDKNGNPVFNSDEGSAEATELLQRTVVELQAERQVLREMVSERDKALSLATKQTSRPARSPWDFGLEYAAPFEKWLDVMGATVYLGPGYHFELAGLDVGVDAALGVTPGRVTDDHLPLAGKLGVRLRP